MKNIEKIMFFIIIMPANGFITQNVSKHHFSHYSLIKVRALESSKDLYKSYMEFFRNNIGHLSIWNFFG